LINEAETLRQSILKKHLKESWISRSNLYYFAVVTAKSYIYLRK